MENSASTAPCGKLNPIQVSLLRLFDREMTDEQVLELKRALVKHYSALLHEELTQIADERGYSQEDYDKILNSKT
ncbi:hypothetical protein GCM10023187_38180 [Nibrella viscosa]|uniref:Uncharacterized protein n=1 Tax=Nibrella viscosa TaxID=1084524 RepID=A0ABP8KQ36_9BACT